MPVAGRRLEMRGRLVLEAALQGPRDERIEGRTRSSAPMSENRVLPERKGSSHSRTEAPSASSVRSGHSSPPAARKSRALAKLNLRLGPGQLECQAARRRQRELLQSQARRDTQRLARQLDGIEPSHTPRPDAPAPRIERELIPLGDAIPAIAIISASVGRGREQDARCGRRPCISARRERTTAPAHPLHRSARRARRPAGTGRVLPAPCRCDRDSRASGSCAANVLTQAPLLNAPRWRAEPIPPPCCAYRPRACRGRGGSCRAAIQRALSLPPRPRSTISAAISAASRACAVLSALITMRASRGGNGNRRSCFPSAVIRPRHRSPKGSVAPRARHRAQRPTAGRAKRACAGRPPPIRRSRAREPRDRQRGSRAQQKARALSLRLVPKPVADARLCSPSAAPPLIRRGPRYAHSLEPRDADARLEPWHTRDPAVDHDAHAFNGERSLCD